MLSNSKTFTSVPQKASSRNYLKSIAELPILPNIYFMQRRNDITERIQFSLGNILRHEMGKGTGKGKGKDFLCFW